MTTETQRYAEWVARLMAEDGFTPENFSADAVIVYMEKIGRQIEKMQTIYMTTPAARQSFQSLVSAI